MASEQARVACLRLAHERLGKDAPIADLFAEARRLAAFVDGFDEPATVDGELVMGKRL